MAEVSLFDDDRAPFRYPRYAIVAAICVILILFAAPATVFLKFMVRPESESCWTSDSKDTATPKPTLRTDDFEVNMAPLFALWVNSGFVLNMALIVSFAYALRVPCAR